MGLFPCVCSAGTGRNYIEFLGSGLSIAGKTRGETKANPQVPRTAAWAPRASPGNSFFLTNRILRNWII